MDGLWGVWLVAVVFCSQLSGMLNLLSLMLSMVSQSFGVAVSALISPCWARIVVWFGVSNLLCVNR